MNPPPYSGVLSFRPTWAEISKSAFQFNLNQIKKWVGPRVQVLAVLKADGYGHGAGPLARVAVEEGAAAMGVSSLEEGIALREEKISSPILILGGLYPLENFSIALKHGLTPTVASLEAARALQRFAQEARKQVSFHLKIDTGMGRIGISPNGAKQVLEWVAQAPEIKMTGMYSHLSCAETDSSFSHEQLRQFEYVLSISRNLGFMNITTHIANSAALIAGKSFHLGMVRPGLALYGSSLTKLPAGWELKPVLSWQTRVVFLKKVPANTAISYGATYRTRRESDIATLPVGYADGLPRRASNKGAVLIRGKRCPIVGRVTMDHIMVDVTGVGAAIGDGAVLIGRDAEEVLSSEDWATWAETNPYEILCGISKRVPRVLVS